MAPKDSYSKLWYSQGLRFKCQRCGKCCSGPSGYVEFSHQEAKTMAQELRISLPDFQRKYTRTEFAPRYYFKEVRSPFGWDCIMLDRDPTQPQRTRCRIHSCRPKQCRTWPFWSINTCDRQSWDEAAERCPGLDHGTLYDAATITDTSADDGLYVPLP